MMSAAVLALLVASVSVCRAAADIDVISRMDRSMMPYSGGGANPFRRYRYPIYNTKRLDYEDDGGDPSSAEDDLSKRFLRGVSLRPLRAKKPYGLSSRYDLTMSPYDLKVMDKLYRSGRRKRRTPDLYDVQQVYKLYEAGRKRDLSSAPDAEDDDEQRKRSGDFSPRDVWDMAHVADAGKRSPVSSYYDLLDMAKLAKAGKRAGADSYSLWHLAQMEAAGKKRSITDQDLLSLARMQAAGKKRGVTDHDLLSLARMQAAGKKRGVTDQDLLSLARMQAAGKKRGVSDQDLLSLARMQAAGKKRGVTDYDLLSLARIADAGKRSGSHLVVPYNVRLDSLADGELSGEAGDDGGDDDQLATKKKRSLDDYIGWDRKKKSVGDALVNNYLNTMEEKVLGKSDRTSTSDDMGMVMKKEGHGDAQD